MTTTSFVAIVAASTLLLASPKLATGSGRPPHVIGSSSVSHRRKKHAPPVPASAGTAADQKALVDAVLGDALAQLSDQADAHFEVGEYNHSILLEKIVVAGDPKNMDAFADAAWLLWSGGHSTEAIALLKDGIASNPTNYYLYSEMGDTYWLLMKDPVQAIPYYESAVKYTCPWLVWHSLAHCYEKTGKWEQAVAAWAAAAKYPDDSLAASRLERARAHLHDPGSPALATH